MKCVPWRSQPLVVLTTNLRAMGMLDKDSLRFGEVTPTLVHCGALSGRKEV
jgi:hypothetical protein